MNWWNSAGITANRCCGCFASSLRTLQRRMTGWRVANAEQVVGMQMEAFQEQENDQLNRKEKPRQR
jgi:hypothetical protein